MRMAFLGACALLLAGCSGANVLYLHSESDAKAASSAIAGLAASKASHIAFIEGERAFLNASHKIDRNLVMDRLLATRDFHLIRLLNDGWKAFFQKELRARAAVLLGDEAAFGVTARSRDAIAMSLTDQLGSFSKINALALEGVYRDYQRFEGRFVAAQGALTEGSGCTLDKTLTQTKASKDKAKAQYPFSEMQAACDRIRVKLSELCKVALNTPSGLWVDGCREIANTGLGGSLHMATAQKIQMLDLLIKAQKATAKAISKKLADAKAAFAKAEAGEAPSFALEREVCEAAGALNGIIAALTPAPAETAVSPTGGAAGSVCGGKSKEEENTADATQTPLVSLAETLQATEQVAAFFRAERAKIVESKAVEVLKEISAQTPGEEITTENKTARISLGVMRALGQFRDFQGADDIPSVSALAIAVAANNAAARAAQIESEYLKSRRSLLSLKLKAIESELYYLAEASKAALGVGAAAQRKVARRVAESWARGRVQSSLIGYDLLKARREAWLAREAAATVAAYDVISPALTELSTFADGGVKPELVAQILGILGISAIATGVN